MSNAAQEDGAVPLRHLVQKMRYENIQPGSSGKNASSACENPDNWLMPLVLIGKIREKANNISSDTQETVSEDAEVEPRKNYPVTIMDNSFEA